MIPKFSFGYSFCNVLPKTGFKMAESSLSGAILGLANDLFLYSSSHKFRQMVEISFRNGDSDILSIS